ncbi:hypothetical protein HYN59_09660 [Flavobacterium album]|uniref:Uncharacterized protein n=1 Tax=Flavobacterium album TaxID=2175091 RepID=A0A2S1QYB4_9FLAO|nr:hypothetical protein [Flavobacterium album]AWH85364.1 hypothetical protein HYN59_09660 [Flavobacterium album]
MASSKQTPAPKSSSGTPLHKQDTPELKNSMKEAEKGAAKKTAATKTPQKIQEGKTAEHKKEY